MDSESGKRKTRKISVSDFGDFLDAKGISKKCSECGHESFAINVFKEYVGVVNLPVAKVGEDGFLETSPVVTMPSYSISCVNCGFSKMFTLATVAKWVEESQKAESENE